MKTRVDIYGNKYWVYIEEGAQQVHGIFATEAEAIAALDSLHEAFKAQMEARDRIKAELEKVVS